MAVAALMMRSDGSRSDAEIEFSLRAQVFAQTPKLQVARPIIQRRPSRDGCYCWRLRFAKWQEGQFIKQGRHSRTMRVGCRVSLLVRLG
jgi:hypothetical protein